MSDEYDTARIVGDMDKDALRTGRALGWSGRYSGQSLPEDDELAETVEANCAVRIVHGVDSGETLKRVVRWFLRDLNENREHYRRKRQLHDGYGGAPTVSRSWDKDNNFTETRGETYIAQYRDIEDVYYLAISDQITLLERRIQSLQIGERLCNYGGIIRLEKVAITRDVSPYGMDAKVERWKQQMIEASEFYVTGNSCSLDSFPAVSTAGNGSPGTSNIRKPPQDLRNLDSSKPKKPRGGHKRKPSDEGT